MSNFFPAALTIAGSDSGGGAGIQADLRTFNAFKVYGCSVITAITAQNPDAVRKVDVLPAEAVEAQLEAVMELFPVQFAKTGMLANRSIVESTAKLVRKHQLRLVVDPVMVSTSGARLLENSAVEAILYQLLPAAEWVTPNIPEAELILQAKLHTPSDLVEAALSLYKKYQCNVVLKGGHLSRAATVSDVVCYQGKLFALSTPAVEVAGNTAHGTGCTLSAAIAAALALGKSWQHALKAAKAFVYGALCERRNLTASLAQMYPPEKDYLDCVSIQELPAAAE